MTLNLKIKNNNTSTYACKIERQGSVVARLQPQDEQDVSMWDGAPLTITEEPAAAAQASETKA